MADSDVELLNSDGKSSEKNCETEELKFKCCGKKCAVMVCVNCYSVFHNSCSTRLKIKKLDETKVICCELNPMEQKIIDINYKKLELELQLVKKLMAEMEDKNNILKENNRLLLEKITTLTIDKPIIQQMATNIKQAVSAERKQQTAAAKSVNIQNKEDCKQVKETMPKAEQKSETGQTEAINETSQDEDGFRFQRRQNRNNYRNQVNHSDERGKKEQKRKQIGQATHDQNQVFQGIQPKMWLYLYRVIPKIGESDIKEYIKKKLGNEEDIIVRELKNGNHPRQCFMVATKFEFKDKLYDPGFWPKGVGFRRFDFKKQWEYKDQQNETNRNSFLA